MFFVGPRLQEGKVQGTWTRLESWAFNPCFPGIGLAKPLQVWGPIGLLTLS